MTDEKMRLANRERQRKYREAHREEINQQRKERYNNRIANGKCPRCGGKVKKGYTLCAECCEYQADLNRKYAKERKQPSDKATTAKAASKTTAKKPAAKVTAKTSTAKKPAAKTSTKSAAAKTKTTTKQKPEKQAKPKTKK